MDLRGAPDRRLVFSSRNLPRQNGQEKRRRSITRVVGLSTLALLAKREKPTLRRAATSTRMAANLSIRTLAWSRLRDVMLATVLSREPQGPPVTRVAAHSWRRKAEALRTGGRGWQIAIQDHIPYSQLKIAQRRLLR